MIKSIQIKNFKSVVDLSLDLGYFNVLIGENGCGKSNILEAVAFGAAASADKLDYEFLGSRGIRVPNPDFMFSAFTNGKKKKSITINITNEERTFKYNLINNSKNPKKWINKNKEIALKEIDRVSKPLFFEKDEKDREKVLGEIKEKKEKEKLKALSDMILSLANETDVENTFATFYHTILEKIFSHPDISNYIIYSPEQSSLRKFEESTQIYPLGIKGEGLFQYLKELTFNKKNKKTLTDIRRNLILLDWYEDFDLPEILMNNEFALKIKDRYLHENFQYFDQRSTNEGFLYLLFYYTLFIAKTTPKFFAIDNIDSSLNPKLCVKLVNNLSELAKQHKKQVIVTTHNPAILDGLNLKDSNQRLFVIKRNYEGHTKAKRIEYKDERKMKLSEIWTNGFIGGLPENF